MPAKNNAALERAEKRRLPRVYVTQEEAAEYLGVTSRTIRQMIADGRLQGYSLGWRIQRLRLDEIDAAMAAGGGAS
jgi:excisionase family DNA binding protein